MEPWVLAHGLKTLRECLKLALDTDPLVVVPACPKVEAVLAETAEPRERILEERREGAWTRAGVLRIKAKIRSGKVGPEIHNVVELVILRRRLDELMPVELGDELLRFSDAPLLLQPLQLAFRRDFCACPSYISEACGFSSNDISAPAPKSTLFTRGGWLNSRFL